MVDVHEDKSTGRGLLRAGVRVGAAMAGGMAVLSLLSGCGEPSARPMDDEFAGNSGESAESTGAGSSAAEGDGHGDRKDCCNDGNGSLPAEEAYADGDYAAKGQYGPVGEDTIDVYLSVRQGKVDDVRVVGHPFTSISRNHQDDFAEAIPGVVEGRDLRELKVDKVAGASWTTDAFNAALDEIRRQAAEG